MKKQQKKGGRQIKNIIKTEKGITMVALVIEIILIIILLGVSVTLIIGKDNLIMIAKNIAAEYNNEANKEKELLKNIFGIQDTEEPVINIEEKIINGGFEEPSKANESGHPTYAYTTLIEGWNTTATDKKIELGWVQKHDTLEGATKSPHMPLKQSNFISGNLILEGNQFGEVNADESGTMYQTFTLYEPTKLDFRMYHRGRSGIDTLAIIIGNAQQYEPSKVGNIKSNKDQYQQMVDWLKENKPIEIENKTAVGRFVYTTAFTENGGFESDNPFSLTPDENHNQKWSVWIVGSGNALWNEFSGSYTAETAGDYIMAMTSYTADETGNALDKVGTWGNLLDGISLKANGKELIKNGGFEDVTVTNGRYLTETSANNPTNPNTQIGWFTTTVEKKIEIGASIETYIKNVSQISTIDYNKLPYVREGKQFAELNAVEQSSLYQNIETEGGKKYFWGLSHRGRMGIDKMALIIGPKQSVNPSKEGATTSDHFVKIIDWLKEQPGIDYGGSEVGCSVKISVYTTKFLDTKKGEFVEASSGTSFSLTKDEEHTEKWDIWIISSNNDKWYDYGSRDALSNYDFSYSVPEEQGGSILAFVSYLPAPTTSGVVDYSWGNLIDYITFAEQYKKPVIEPTTEKETSIVIKMEE